ncbi:MAG TPA: hypothetical protein VJU59_48275 [Paraburkholderia sp.]|uniref:hypothetical protein n=1 Tax=Paraburkholderia sp. TaxID=1926495 RepID=UPI002B486E88|nr:hypothetical protein [Paraburkholderia sp.]HKR47383.1 hypothetical protein [Paraburkholderia sp.]
MYPSSDTQQPGAAVKAAGLVDTLKSKGPFSVPAPIWNVRGIAFGTVETLASRNGGCRRS